MFYEREVEKDKNLLLSLLRQIPSNSSNSRHRALWTIIIGHSLPQVLDKQIYIDMLFEWIDQLSVYPGWIVEILQKKELIFQDGWNFDNIG